MRSSESKEACARSGAERLAILQAPFGAGHGADAFWSEDPPLVELACAAFLEAWDASVSWQDAGLPTPLPERRYRVAVCLVEGLTDQEIATRLGISRRTVSAEVRAVVDWLGARSRGHAVARLVGAG